MKTIKWDIVPATLEKIRKWAYMKTSKDLASRIVYGVHGVGIGESGESYESGESDEQKFLRDDEHKIGRHYADEAHRKQGAEKKRKDFQKWVERIEAFEAGKDKPTLSQLKEIAKHCHQPYPYFQAPAEKISLPHKPEDFRKNTRKTIAENPQCHNFIFETIAKHEWIRHQFRKSNPHYRASFLDLPKELKNLPEELKGIDKQQSLEKNSLVGGARQLAEKIKKDFGIASNFDFWSKQPPKTQLEELKKAVDRKNILVFTTDSKKPSHRFGLDLLKGFAIYDEVIPLVALNNGDFEQAGGRYAEKIFTLVHELAHLYIFKNKDVVSGGFPLDGNVSLEDEWQSDEVRNKERFCNMVAEEFIMPQGVFENIVPLNLRELSPDGVAASLQDVAKQHRVSKWVLLYRSLHLGKLNRDKDFSKGKEDKHACQIFSKVRKNYFAASEKYRQDKRARQSSAERAKPIDKEDGDHQANSDTAKRIVEINSRLFCQVALGSYMSSELDHKTLTDLLNIKHFSDVGSLQEKTGSM